MSTRRRPIRTGNMAQSALVAGALHWAAMGVPVFPCNLDKSPLVENGHLQATTDAEQIKRWFNRSDVLIGGAMGAGLFCVDVDLYKGASPQQWLQEMKERPDWTPTRVHTTLRGGRHFIFKGDCPTMAPASGVEIKGSGGVTGSGGYIILPPSAGYSIERDVEPEHAPSSLVSWLESQRRTVATTGVTGLEQMVLSASDFHEPIVQLAAHKASQGLSHIDLTAYVNKLLGASVAANPVHPRHERWLGLVQDQKGELARILTSATGKFNLAESEATAVEGLTAEQLQMMQSAAATVFGRHDAPEPIQIEYTGQDPFGDDGYMVGDDIPIANTRAVVWPLFNETETVLLAAEPKAGKTAIMLKTAFNLACGKDLGETLKVPEQRGVLYFALEGTNAVRLRLEAEKRRTGHDGGIPFKVVERSRRLVDEQAQDELVQKITALNQYYLDHYGCSLGLIVIDTFTKAMPGLDQNSVEDTSKLFAFVSKLRDAGCTACVTFVHHMSRTGNVRGSTNIEADPDTILELKNDSETKTSRLAVRMARTIDDSYTYNFKLSGYSLGETSQGFALEAVVVDLEEYAAPVAAGDDVTDARTAVEQGELLQELTSLGAGEHSPADYCAGRATVRKKAAAVLRKRIERVLPSRESYIHADFVVTITRRGKLVNKIRVDAIEQTAPG